MKVKYMYILIDMTCKSHMLELLQSEHFFLPIFIRATIFIRAPLCERLIVISLSGFLRGLI